VRDMTLPNGHGTKTIAFPMAIRGHEFEVYRSPPLLGEHTEEVFGEWLEKQERWQKA
jgi:succinate--hydroxymethylglutarate CoA-transferase